MSTGSILSILAYPQYGNHLVCHTGLSLVHGSYLSVGSLQQSWPLYFSHIRVRIAKSAQFSVSGFQERFEVC